MSDINTEDGSLYSGEQVVSASTDSQGSFHKRALDHLDGSTSGPESESAKRQKLDQDDIEGTYGEDAAGLDGEDVTQSGTQNEAHTPEEHMESVSTEEVPTDAITGKKTSPDEVQVDQVQADQVQAQVIQDEEGAESQNGTQSPEEVQAHDGNKSHEKTDYILKDGIPIPSDSALLTSVYIPQSTELSQRMLIKANLASLPLSLQANDSLPIRVQFVINTVPVLDNVATQILRIIGVAPYEETLAIVTTDEPTPESLVFGDLVKLFGQVKEFFSVEDPFLDMEHVVDDRSTLSEDGLKSLKEIEQTIDTALKKSNLATFLLAALGAVDVGLSYLNESFLDVFCPTPCGNWFNGKMGSGSFTAGKLLKAQAGLFLELKTQTYISGVEFSERPKEELLDEIFPFNLQDLLLRRRQAAQLTPVESDFIFKCTTRRDTLLNSPDTEDLSENYDWLIFLKELFGYVSKNIGFLLWGRKPRTSLLPSLTDLTSPTTIIPSDLTHLTKEEIHKRLEEQKEREKELQQEAEKEPLTAKRKRVVRRPKPVLVKSSQSKSTTVTPRIKNMLRRAWSPEEEEALVEALKEVGPRWSKILDYYGPGGTKSEVLRNRTQVQLKDKSRNWKMAYLKNSQPMPDYLKKVTGELERDDRAMDARRRRKQRLQDQKKAQMTDASEITSKETTPLEHIDDALPQNNDNEPLDGTST